MEPAEDPENNLRQMRSEATRLPNAQVNENNVIQLSDRNHNGRDRSAISSGGSPPPRVLTMPVGHPRLAELMSLRPQMGIYRRFGYLNAQNLLYMQAELVSLEKSLKRLQNEDAGADDKQVSQRAHDWEELSKATATTTPTNTISNTTTNTTTNTTATSAATASSEGHGINESSAPRGASCCGHKRCEEWCDESNPHVHCPQWNLAMKIREKLQRYNDALIQQINLASAGAPDSYDLEWIQHFLNSQTFDMKDALQGDDKTLWGGNGKPDNAEHDYDLIALVPLSKRDPFNEWISKRLVKWILNRKSWRNSASKNRSLENKTLLRWTTAATSAVTATVPIVSIVALYFTKDTNVQLALLAVFNLLAAFVLYIFTDAHPMQVFAASAAYSAVNIVFIGSNATSST